MQTITDSIPLYAWGLFVIIVSNYVFGRNLIKGVGVKWLIIYSLIVTNIIGLIGIFYSIIPSPINDYLGMIALLILVFWVISLYVIGIYYRNY